ncbi:MAG: putative exopolyphosphatase [Clostridia bacterium]|jgi:exopolyphosphatase/guanosine-5'-triphosphate,3'-diphosphate pyrophosphatase|nr:putative exopolyphosphatase [Clostridia bacterium]
MKKVAAIDIGTNSMRLLLCEYDKGHFANKEKHLIVTRMGQGLSANGVISQEAIERNINALIVFKEKADQFGAQEMIAIATSAVRDAGNREVFLKAAKQHTGIDIMVISGETEADLGITGVASDNKEEAGNILVIDIGGGSTELVLGGIEGISYSTSINAGTVRMTEKFITSHPIAENEIEKLKHNLKELFEEPIKQLKTMSIQKIIAIGGTATTIAAIYHSLCIYDPQKVHNTVIAFDYLQNLLEQLKNMSVEQRYDVKGLQKERADVIPAGMIIMLHIMKNLGIASFSASENDNLEGAIIKFIQ